MGVPSLSSVVVQRVSLRPRGLTELDDLESVFNALAHQSRRTILSVLYARGGEMSSGAIAARFDCSWPTTTRHLRVLEEAGLVHVALRGRERVYRLDIVRLGAVVGTWLNRFDINTPARQQQGAR
jgi:DNA-binding transcriptional ArsR family regulator